MTPKEIERYLYENELYPDGVYECVEYEDSVNIEIIDGDWKHDHGRCRHLMAKAGYIHQETIIIEEDGSDSYSAIHRYTKI
jgi:hypothetical protein